MTTSRVPVSNIKLSILRAVHHYNSEYGEGPSKREAIWYSNLRGSHTPGRGRGGRYTIVDSLINDGYLTNVSTSSNRYALMITPKGIEALS